MRNTDNNRIPFMPVDPDFTDVLEQNIREAKSGKVHFFNDDNLVDTMEGQAAKLIEREKATFLQVGDVGEIRIDRIITLFGRPGPAYDEYDRYANACLTCEDIGQFGA